MTALDIAANNVANATTPGYRADRALFRQELNRAKDNSAGTRSMHYAITRTIEPDLKQGQLIYTGRPTDIALRDPRQRPGRPPSADAEIQHRTPPGEVGGECPRGALPEQPPIMPRPVKQETVSAHD